MSHLVRVAVTAAAAPHVSLAESPNLVVFVCLTMTMMMKMMMSRRTREKEENADPLTGFPRAKSHLQTLESK